MFITLASKCTFDTIGEHFEHFVKTPFCFGQMKKKNKYIYILKGKEKKPAMR